MSLLQHRHLSWLTNARYVVRCCHQQRRLCHPVTIHTYMMISKLLSLYRKWGHLVGLVCLVSVGLQPVRWTVDGQLQCRQWVSISRCLCGPHLLGNFVPMLLQLHIEQRQQNAQSARSSLHCRYHTAKTSTSQVY